MAFVIDKQGEYLPVLGESSNGGGGSENPWVGLDSPESIASSVQYPFSEDKEYDLSTLLPNDGEVYEVLFTGYCLTDLTPSVAISLRISTSIIPRTFICFARNTSEGELAQDAGSVILPVGTDRKVKILLNTSYAGKVTLEVCGYKKVG